MLTREAYLADPCGSSSIPFWKRERWRLPERMRIVHQRDFAPDMACGFDDCPYFRLRHDLEELETGALPGYEMATAAPEELDDVVAIINAAYTDLRVTRAQMRAARETPVYRGQLWVFAKEISSGEKAGCGIAEFDAEVGELSLEWIQVRPEWRRRGIGRAIVHELLRRKPAGARFATVSGKAGGDPGPERLYRSCGFYGQDVWHVLTRRE